jgi:ankyrin repeat protein
MAALSGREAAQRALERAIEADDGAAVAAAIVSGASMNAYLSWRPLHRAATHGKLAAFRALLAGGADPVALLFRHSIVHAALEGGHAALIREAIAAREAVAPRLPPLHVAAAADDDGAAVAAVLASGGAGGVNAEAGDADGGVTAIHVAASCGNVGAIRALAAAGGRVDAADGSGRQPMHVAASGEDVDAIRALAGLGGRVDATDRSGRQPMHVAAASGHVAVIRELAAAGGRVDAADKSCRQSMHVAAARGHVGAIRALAELGGRVDAADERRMQAIHLASLDGHVEAIRALVELGGRVDAAGGDGRQPMHEAAWGGRVAAVRALAELGGRVDAADERGRRPMHLVAAGGFVGAIHTLAEHGASFACVDVAECTPLHYALSPGGFRPQPHIDAALQLIAAGAPTSARDSAGTTPLHLAADIPSKAVVLALLAAGADPTIQDNEGRFAVQRVPNTAAAPITGDPVKEAIVDALQTAMHAVFAARGAGSLPAWLGTLRGSVRRLLLPTTAEAAITPAQIEAATVDASVVEWDRGADGQLVRLGGGSFGAVYAGTLRLADGGVAAVALKQMLVAAPSAAGGASSATAEQQDAAFWCEVVVHHGCSSHAGIVRCHGGFVRDREGGRERVMVMERCVGSLTDALHGRMVDAASQHRDPATAHPVTPAQRLTWARQLVAALAYLHGRDIVHGDVKSENVLLDGDGNVRVSDLGGAALRREENAAAADAAHMGERGSPAYMCPALGLGRAPLSKASDVYSCGVLVWEVLSGVWPWSRGEAAGVATAAQLYGAVAEGMRPSSGAELTGLAPRGVGDWIAAMWHPHPRMRPPLEDVAEALRVLCGGAERLPRRRRDDGWAESFGVSAAAGARTRVAAGLVAPAVVATGPPEKARSATAIVHDPAAIAAALGQLQLDDLAFGGTRGGSA